MNELQHSFESLLPLIEDDLKRFIETEIPQTQPVLRAMFEHHMGWKSHGRTPGTQGKRLRPMIAHLCANYFQLTPQEFLPVSSGIELLHNFSLIHDDIEDHDEKRHGRETLWMLWGIPQAINTGDLMFSMASASLLRAQQYFPAERIVALMEAYHQTCQQLTVGQHLDMSFEDEHEVSPQDYLRMIHGKTAALLGFCCAAGAILSGAEQNQIEALREFGTAVGLAFQIQDDYLGIWGDIQKTGKASRSDLLDRKKSLPILLGISSRGEFSQRWNQLDRITPDIADELADLLDQEGIREKTANEVKKYTEKATSRLDPFETISQDTTNVLRQLVAKLMNRNY